MVMSAKDEDGSDRMNSSNCIEDCGPFAVCLRLNGHVPNCSRASAIHLSVRLEPRTQEEEVRLFADRIEEPRLLDHLSRMLDRRPRRMSLEEEQRSQRSHFPSLLRLELGVLMPDGNADGSCSIDGRQGDIDV